MLMLLWYIIQTWKKNRYFVYRHIRLDTNEVFYVGVGTKPLNPQLKPWKGKKFSEEHKQKLRKPKKKKK